MSKFALPALILGILALFAYSVTSQPDDATAEPAQMRSELAPNVAQPAQDERRPEQQPAGSNGQNVNADLQRLSEDAKANGDKIAALRSDLLKQAQDSKASSEKAAQTALEQINALRTEQAKIREDGKAAQDKATQSLREEIAASQAKLLAQVGDGLKASTARVDALGQRVDAMKKDFDELKKGVDEDRQNASSISPGIALIVALAALVLGPFLAYQFVANQLAGARQQVATPVVQPEAAMTAEAETPPSASALHHEEEVSHHEAPPLGEETIAHHEVDEDRQPEHDENRQPIHDPERT